MAVNQSNIRVNRAFRRCWAEITARSGGRRLRPDLLGSGMAQILLNPSLQVTLSVPDKLAADFRVRRTHPRESVTLQGPSRYS